MNSTLDVIFLTKDDAAHKEQLDSLGHLGFRVRVCPDLVSLYEHYGKQSCPLLVLSAPLADIHIAAVRIRAMDRSVGIIALAHFTDSEARVRTLLCGADACLDRNASGLELAAVLQSLLRRITSLSAPAVDAGERADPAFDPLPEESALPAWPGTPAKWRLANRGWTLVSPSGRALGLTTGERAFLSRLMTAPERKLSRDALLPEELGVEAGAQRSRFVDVMISRLRRKASHHQMALPIRAVHGWGYMFAAEVAHDHDAAEAA
ncbi:response regulator transcription factor [Bordetella hinzii]|uniref:DNA-binding response regulator n=1 Tax=Bordetella hinzii TaxID=103855 RepID=A0AAN1RVS0_9BORD|nr:winged helix-turn-helix domain-containing protein [Bordetella hinzii]AKQ54024.1 Transcriptional regulatory protein OmpR [Bordetella hinzii]AKQ58515.1 Transcriptional regulatory protein OmpR [Bordetella hinzii]AZW16177.1 DNA-binding response regulator [Bordetella hinzii]KCB29206.1 transcriptional regulatory protein, C-terminal domain protein [Bordetella hinzii CA90 BAL1384]KCB33710.1 transcriptional regulatory protein, C-terminal domain protein [Bordetella hinzii L60]